jgi:hypothetical protein
MTWPAPNQGGARIVISQILHHFINFYFYHYSLQRN